MARYLLRSLGPLLASAAASWASFASAAPTLPTIPSTVFMVTSYGALGDGATDNTSAIQKAISAAEAAKGGIVEVPAAPAPYLFGPVSIVGNVNLQVDAGAVLRALPYGSGTNAPGTYPLAGTAYTNLISISGSNVEVSGSGTIDGQGLAWWNAYNANSAIPHRPFLIKVSSANFVWIKDVTLKDSPQEHLAFSSSSNVTIDGITITCSPTSPNTDGIDPAGSHYLIQNCNISDGDDDIVMKPQGILCTDILIQNCTIGAGHGMSIGGQTNSGLNGMTVNNIVFNGTQYGLRMKADPTEGGIVQNVAYSNLTMTNVQYPIVFYSYYDQVGTPGATSGSLQTTPAKVKSWNATPPNTAYNSYNTFTMPVWQNITISNVVSTNPSGIQGYSVIWGVPNDPIANVTLNNVQISGSSGFEFYNAKNIQLTGNSNLGGPIITYNAQVVVQQPSNQTAAVGGTEVLTAQVVPTSGANGPIAHSFQWTLGGTALTDGAQAGGSTIAGSNSSTLIIRNAQGALAGSYVLNVTDALDTYKAGLQPNGASASASSSPATLSVISTTDVSRLVNVSARASVGTGGDALIVGFELGGAGTTNSSKTVLTRAVGPSLAAFGVSGFLPDPLLQLYALPSASLVASNDNWGGGQALLTAAAQSGAFPLSSGTSLDSALVSTLSPGTYSANVTGTTTATGVALAEIYDMSAFSPTAPRLINLSARGSSGAGSNSLIAGFVVAGSTSKAVLLRVTGPALSAFGVTGVLADPSFQLFNATGGLVAYNDNWSGDPAVTSVSAEVKAFPLTDPSSLDAAEVLSLPPGAYTLSVSGSSFAAGAALVELYELP